VTLHGLENKTYNECIATIADFNQERLRFVVNLRNGKQILVKACNLREIMHFGPYVKLRHLYLSLGEDDITSVKEVESIWKKMKKVCDDRTILANAFLLIINTLTHFTIDASIMLKFIGIAKAFVEDVEDQRLKVDLSVRIAVCYGNIGEAEKNKIHFFHY